MWTRVSNTALYSQRSVLLCEDEQDSDTSQLNPIAKAVFGVASVTFEVRVLSVESEAKVTLDRLALEGTKQIRPNGIGPSRSLAAHFALGEQGRR